MSDIGEEDPPTFYGSLSKDPEGGKLQISSACGTNVYLPVLHTRYLLAAFVSVQYQLSHIRWGVSDFGCGQASASIGDSTSRRRRMINLLHWNTPYSQALDLHFYRQGSDGKLVRGLEPASDIGERGYMTLLGARIVDWYSTCVLSLYTRYGCTVYVCYSHRKLQRQNLPLSV